MHLSSCGRRCLCIKKQISHQCVWGLGPRSWSLGSRVAEKPHAMQQVVLFGSLLFFAAFSRIFSHFFPHFSAFFHFPFYRSPPPPPASFFSLVSEKKIPPKFFSAIWGSSCSLCILVVAVARYCCTVVGSQPVCHVRSSCLLGSEKLVVIKKVCVQCGEATWALLLFLFSDGLVLLKIWACQSFT